MNRFRRSQSSNQRTPEERERDRAEREQRRRADEVAAMDGSSPSVGQVGMGGWIHAPPRPVGAPIGWETPSGADAPTPLRPPNPPRQPLPEEPAPPTSPPPAPDGPPQVVPLRRRDEPSAPLDPAARAGADGRRRVGWRARAGKRAGMGVAGPGVGPRAAVGGPPRGGVGASAGPTRGRARRRVFAILAILVAVGLVWFLYSLFEPFKGDGHGQVAVTIPPGTGAQGVGDILARDHVVSSGFFFSIRAFLSGKRSDLHAGHYTLRRDMSYGAALDALTRKQAPVRAVKVTLPEGETRREMAGLARADGLTGSYLAASDRSSALSPSTYGAPRGTHTLEGFLFPATYDLVAGAPAQRLVTEQLAAFKRAFGRVNLSWARAHHLTPYDVLTTASMVEREAGVARDRPLIAAVIYNRLRLHMPLGIDATIRYALNDWTRPLTASQLRSPSRYNTRLHRGLPPTPIGNPGLASLEAAAHPAHVSYLYYVVKPGGHGEHLFATTFAQFQRDVARYQQARARNGGRSPTH